MLANYGYQDASGIFYIQIDTAKCAECEVKGCVSACPQNLFVEELDDFDEKIIAIREEERNNIAFSCGACKSVKATKTPCIEACIPRALVFTW